MRGSATVLAAGLMLAASDASAHQLNVFASTDCETLLVEAKFSSGRMAVAGEVRISDGEETVLMTGEIGEDGTLAVPMADIPSSTGLLIVVDTGDHDDFWILTPDDIARKCQS